MTPFEILSLAALAAFCGLVVVAAVSDLLTMTIPNRISVGLLVAFLAFAPAVGMPPAAFGLHLASGALVLAVAFGLFAAGWIGGGDAKLAAAIALWLGFGDLAAFLVVAALFGGLLTLAILMLRRLPLPLLVGNWTWLMRLQDRSVGVPYGIALSAAALYVLPTSTILRLV